jgi:long-subunit fatty acid transport protein
MRTLLLSSVAAVLPAVDVAFIAPRTVVTDTEFLGVPNAVGAGARAQGMGYAFSAVADDATANTWNPGGMSQLERPELAVSLALRRKDSGDDASLDGSIDHASFVFPFHLGVQQTLGVAWQRQYDFDQDLSLRRFDAAGSEVVRLFTDQDREWSRSGSFSTLSFSYAVEPLYGLGLGVTLNLWDHDITGMSKTEFRDRINTSVLTVTNLPGIGRAESITLQTVETAIDREVTSGASWVIGAHYTPLPQWRFSGTVRLPYTLKTEVRQRRQALNITPADPARNGYDDRGESRIESRIEFPLQATGGVAFQPNDENTLTLEATWTRWSRFIIEEPNISRSGIQSSLNPDVVDDTWTIRAGYERIFIRPRAVFALRGGAYFEQLPGTAPAPDLNRQNEIMSVTDKYWGITLGGGLFLRRHLVDLGVELRHGDGVGSGTLVAPTETIDTWDLLAKVNYTFHF